MVNLFLNLELESKVVEGNFLKLFFYFLNSDVELEKFDPECNGCQFQTFLTNLFSICCTFCAQEFNQCNEG